MNHATTTATTTAHGVERVYYQHERDEHRENRRALHVLRDARAEAGDLRDEPRYLLVRLQWLYLYLRYRLRYRMRVFRRRRDAVRLVLRRFLAYLVGGEDLGELLASHVSFILIFFCFGPAQKKPVVFSREVYASPPHKKKHTIKIVTRPPFKLHNFTNF